MNLRSLKKVNMEVQIIFIAHSDKKGYRAIFSWKITPFPLLKNIFPVRSVCAKLKFSRIKFAEFDKITEFKMKKQNIFGQVLKL